VVDTYPVSSEPTGLPGWTHADCGMSGYAVLALFVLEAVVNLSDLR
jgi:hypothetical protein